jgi:hypothetical protein
MRLFIFHYSDHGFGKLTNFGTNEGEDGDEG